MKRGFPDVAVLPLVVALLLSVISPSPVWADPAEEKVTICHKPGTPDQKTLQVPTNALSGHLAHGDFLGSCSDLPSAGGPAQPEEAGERVTVCHKPGTPAQKTMSVSAAALEEHLGHGDLLGPCEEPTTSASHKVLICHKPRTPAQKTMMVPPDALDAHLDHGDVLGSCQDMLGTTGCRRPVIASSGVSMTTWRVRGRQRPYAQ
jgi:hypothetical protein